jgi:hypothetical protein
MGAVCLFVLFSFNVHSPRRGMWTVTKETGCRPCVLAHTKEILRPQPALCAILGVWVPLTKERIATKRKEDGGDW